MIEHRVEKCVPISLTLVIDDHPLYCDAMAASLSTAFSVKRVKAVNSLREARAFLATGAVPDLIMLDLGLPDASGISGFMTLKTMLPDVPIVVISADSSDETIQMLMDAGATGFVPKDAPRHVIAEALERVQEGGIYLPPGFTPVERDADAPGVDLQELAERISSLTPQQSRIMHLICAGKPNKLIAYELSVAEGTVKAHITALLRRLGVSNRTQAAVLVSGVMASPLMDIDARAQLG